ncbi:CPBP family intramembrane glutamic endopeptidase [Lactonifactor longoviformis]|uniref:CPBP family intramembrane glutamic endopeptidase n=1 Tax=Lactonifactor longoviformis TaxID=341220 RepID=UPI0036F1F1CC
MDKRKLRPYHGLLFFAVVMFSFYFIMAPLQMQFGMYGLAMTELLLLAMAIVCVKLCRADFKEIFPVGRVRFSKAAGTILLWLASFLTVMVLTLIITWFFPDEMLGVSQGLSSVISSVPFAVGFLFTVVMPAVCEEAVHRGVILHSMLPLKKKWLIVLIMGILFGIFHTSIWRFVPTALLGAALSYVMLETENMVYPAIFHGVNNYVPLAISSYSAKILERAGSDLSQTSLNTVPVASIGVYLVMACCVPFAAYGGNHLLHYREEGYRSTFFPKKRQGLIITVLIVSTVLILAAGFALLLYGILFDSQFHDLLRQNM